MTADLFGADHAARRAMGSHHDASSGKDEWLTPPEMLTALGTFDLDPCAPITRPWPTAAHHYTIEDDGLRQEWRGRIWLNPPYSDAGRWLGRLAAHGFGTALIFARTETDTWFEHVWPRASAVLFLRRRINFHHVDGRRTKANAGAPSALIAYSAFDADVLRSGAIAGAFIDLRSAA